MTNSHSANKSTNPQMSSSNVSSANVPDYADILDSSIVHSGLFHRFMNKSHPVIKCNGNSRCAAITQMQWEELCHELEESVVTGAVPLCTEKQIGQLALPVNERNLIPIFIIDAQYHYPHPEFIEKIKVPGNAITSTDFKKHTGSSRAVIATAFIHRKAVYGTGIKKNPKGITASFLLKKDFIFTNRKEKILSVSIDFGDGNGYTTVRFGTRISVQYPKSCNPTLKCLLQYKSGDVHAKVNFKAAPALNAVPDDSWTVQSTIPYKDQKNTAVAYVIYGKVNGTTHSAIVNPILVLEPFAGSGQKMTFDDWNKLLGSLITPLVDAGFDLIFLSQNSPNDYIQRNAFVVVACLQNIAQRRMPGFPLVVLGLNVGALTSRYALSYMEKNNIPHNTACYVSLDGPHQGMCIPIGVQWYVRVLAEIQGNSSAKDQAAVFSSNTARQAMYYYIPSHDYEGSLVDQMHTDFYAELVNLGYPRQTLNIGISTGTRDGLITMPFNHRVIYWHGNLCVGGEVHSQPQNPSSWTKYAEWTYMTTTYSASVLGGTPYDEAPGSQQNFFGALAKSLSDSGYGTVDNDYPNACIVPTTSGIDYNLSQNPYTKIPYAIGNDSFSNFDLYIIEPKLLASAEQELVRHSTVNMLLRVIKIPELKPEQLGKDHKKRTTRSVPKKSR